MKERIAIVEGKRSAFTKAGSILKHLDADDLGAHVRKSLLASSQCSMDDIDEVIIDEHTQSAKVIVKDSQLSLAIGKEGQNARLAAKLTGYKIDIEGLGDSPPEEEEPKQEEE